MGVAAGIPSNYPNTPPPQPAVNHSPSSSIPIAPASNPPLHSDHFDLATSKLALTVENHRARQDMLGDAVFNLDPDLDHPEEMQKKDPLGTQIWKLYSRTKTQLPNQERLENLTWRMMAMNLKRKQEEQERARSVSPYPSLRDASVSDLHSWQTGRANLECALRHRQNAAITRSPPCFRCRLDEPRRLHSPQLCAFARRRRHTFSTVQRRYSALECCVDSHSNQA